MWWDQYGQRCNDCIRNMRAGVIPRDLSTDFHQTDWASNFTLDYYHGVRTPTRKKLIREGLLKGRELKRKDGTTYTTLYFTEENKEFFEKYPRKERNSEEVKETDSQPVSD
jgi:hypothetical protein